MVSAYLSPCFRHVLSWDADFRCPMIQLSHWRNYAPLFLSFGVSEATGAYLRKRSQSN